MCGVLSMLDGLALKWPKRMNGGQVVTGVDAPRSNRLKSAYVMRGLKNLCWIPVFPMIGYFLLDQTGVSAFLV